MTTCVQLTVEGPIARAVLDRPRQLNAISPELLRDLDAACAAVEQSPGVKVMTLTGAGRAFCAGADLAGGLELTLVADLVVAEEDARLGDQHANFGLVAGGGGSQRLPRLIGARRAKELMLLGGWLSAQEALAWGPVNRVAPAGGLAAVLEEIAQALAAKSGGASRTVKALVNLAGDAGLAAGLEEEIVRAAAHLRSADAAEGRRAFAEKRAPRF